MSDEFMSRLAAKVIDIFPVKEEETFDQYCSRGREDPIAGKRDLIAACVRIVSQEISDENQSLKSNWIATARRNFAPGERQNCAVCNRYRLLTHAHHLYPLALQYDDGVRVPDQSFVWLCPNHHAMVHMLLDGTSVPEDVPYSMAAHVLELEGDELLKLSSLVGHRPARIR